MNRYQKEYDLYFNRPVSDFYRRLEDNESLNLDQEVWELTNGEIDDYESFSRMYRSFLMLKKEDGSSEYSLSHFLDNNRFFLKAGDLVKVESLPHAIYLSKMSHWDNIELGPSGLVTLYQFSKKDLESLNFYFNEEDLHLFLTEKQVRDLKMYIPNKS